MNNILRKATHVAFGLLFSLQFGLTGSQAEDSALQGIAEFRSVSSSAVATQLKLSGCRGMRLHCIQVHIKNDADQPISVDGDAAFAEESKGKVQAATLAQTIVNANCGYSSADWALLGLTSFATIGLGEVMMAERLSDPKTLAIPFDRDGTRRRIEDLRLGRRLLMPGDETYGMLCFTGPDIPKLVHIPVSLGQYGSKKGSLDVAVESVGTAKLPPTTSSPPSGTK